jgi:Fic family protein
MDGMIFATPTVDGALADRLAEFDELRVRLGERSAASGPWLGGLRRQWRAEAAESSIEIEGFRLPVDRLALACHTRAMDHVGAMADDPVFQWVDRVILDLHFDACHFQPDKAPGRYRTGGIEVTRPGGGQPAYTGPPAADVPELILEIVQWLQHGDLDAHLAVRAAMAHLHVVSAHPFRDGNGRISRIIQSLVLARGGLLAPEFVSIEEYLGRNTAAYYTALMEVQGRAYQPERDAGSWVRFCVDAHVEQGYLRLEQLAEAGARWAFLEQLVSDRGWPDRLVIALEQSVFGGVDRASYAAEADVSAPTASNDLRRLVDAGHVVQRNKGRTTRYVASEELRRRLGSL